MQLFGCQKDPAQAACGKLIIAIPDINFNHHPPK
jgi:hypothetical protein